MTSKYQFFIGQKVNHWTVLSTEGKMIDCRCSCGAEKAVNRYNLANGKSVSCGCQKSYASVTKHGLSDKSSYQTWKAMKARCYRKSHQDYPRYGGRGIKVCDRWKDSFEAFYADMGDRPGGCSIEREDVDGHYEPGNCRWASQKDQMRNTRRSRRVTISGITKTVAEWSEEAGLSSDVIYKRIYAGWPESDLLSKENHATRPMAQSGERR